MSQKKSPNQPRQVFPVRPETGLDLRSNKTVFWQLRNCVPFFLPVSAAGAASALRHPPEF